MFDIVWTERDLCHRGILSVLRYKVEFKSIEVDGIAFLNAHFFQLVDDAAAAEDFLEVLQRGIVVQIDGSQDWFEEFCINIINAVFDFNFKCSLFGGFCQFFSGERFWLILQNRRQFGQLCTNCLNEFFRSLRGGCRNANVGCFLRSENRNGGIMRFVLFRKERSHYVRR